MGGSEERGDGWRRDGVGVKMRGRRDGVGVKMRGRRDRGGGRNEGMEGGERKVEVNSKVVPNVATTKD